MKLFGLVVEGDYDVCAVSSYVRSQIGNDVSFIPRPCGGPVKKKWLVGHLEEFRLLVDSGQCTINAAIVLVDSDKRDPQVFLQSLQTILSDRPQYPFPVGLSVAVQEMEAWLLADERAISRAVNNTVQAVTGTIEDIPDPKSELFHILAMFSVIYTKERAGEIASYGDLNTIQTKCPWFATLRSSISSAT